MKKRLLFLLTLIGLGITVYLALKAADPSTVACSIGGCEKVLSSQYAKLFNVPLSYYGLAWYLGAGLLVYFTYWRRYLNDLYSKIYVAAGLLFSLYLLSLEMFRIHAYCLWCLGSLAVIVLLIVVTFATKEK